jgi:hypothetical protein
MRAGLSREVRSVTRGLEKGAEIRPFLFGEEEKKRKSTRVSERKSPREAAEHAGKREPNTEGTAEEKRGSS